MLKEIKIPHGENLDCVVIRLNEARKNGEHVFCKYHDVTLYSDNITLDSAYMEVYDCTREEFFLKIEEEIANATTWQKEREKWAEEKTAELIERGKSLMYPQRFKEWEQEMNNIQFLIYFGDDIEEALNIMEAIENGNPIEKIVEKYKDRRKNSFSDRVVRELVLKYSKNGNLFFIETHEGKWKDEDHKFLTETSSKNLEYAVESYTKTLDI